MIRLLIVGFGKIAYMPYMNGYIDVINKIKDTNSITADLLYWERDSKPDIQVPDTIDNSYKFVSHVEESNGFIKKIPSFVKFKLYARKIIRRGSYDKIIILHSTPGLLLLNELNRFKNKYILDYRDFSHENISIYRKLVSRLVKMSKFTFVSSEGFREYLPKVKHIYTTHNLSVDSMRFRDNSVAIRKYNKPIIIRYWGLIRHSKINIEIIDGIANDNRFELHYHGRKQQDARTIEEYCANNNIRNVFFHGEYLPKERNDFALKTHLIHNFYENDKVMKNAMGNKYYDGIIYRIPQLCNLGSFMGTKIIENGLGIAISVDDDFADKIYNYYSDLDYDLFDYNCNKELEKVYEEYLENYKLIESFCKMKGD